MNLGDKVTAPDWSKFPDVWPNWAFWETACREVPPGTTGTVVEQSRLNKDGDMAYALVVEWDLNNHRRHYDDV